MTIYDATQKITPSIEYEIKCSWGIFSLKDIERETGLTNEELIKAAKHLGIDGGKEKIKTLNEINELAKVYAETKGFIPDVVRAFPGKSISSIYKTIESFQKHSNYAPKKITEKAKRFQSKWTIEDKLKIKDFLEAGLSTKGIINEFPDRTESAIAQKVNKVRKELNRNGVTIKDKAKHTIIEPVENFENFVAEDIKKKINEFSKNHTFTGSTYKKDGVFIEVNIRRT